MTNKETVQRNIGLTFDFVDYMIDHPEVLAALPAKFRLEFVEQDFTKRIKKAGRMMRKPTMKEKYVKVRNTFEFVKSKKTG